jgi:hypothetical protein
MRNQLSAAVEAQFPDNAGAMLSNGEFRNCKQICNVLATQPQANLPQNLIFSSGKSRHNPEKMSAFGITI